MYQLLEKALQPYFIGNGSLVIEKELHIASWHHDLHYKILVDGKAYSARFIKHNRSSNMVFGVITNEVLLEQAKFCQYLVKQHIPFMKLVPISETMPFHTVEWEGENYRFILFQWIEGQHITHCNEHLAEEFGKMARRFHDVSSVYDSSVFPKTSHLVGYNGFVDQLRNKMNSLSIPHYLFEMVEDYLKVTEGHLAKATTQSYDFIIQSDLNPLNVIWNDDKIVTGIVDFESIGYTDRIEGLAWLIKWYSRTMGIHSSEMSSNVAYAFLKGYRADEFMRHHDIGRLSSLIWLSGCINWNFVKKTIFILETKDKEELKKHFDFYYHRGEKLLSLIRDYQINE
jgi:Ser/Thr protein kinase RdoA (MazF antagonist)